MHVLLVEQKQIPFPILSSGTSSLLQKTKNNPQVCYSGMITAGNEHVTIVDSTLQQIAPLQETDSSCSGVMILNDCDILVQR